LGGVFIFFTKDDSDYSEEKFVIPETVSLHLRTTFDELETPILELTVYAGGGCDEVSQLDISETSKEGTMFVNISGYSIKEYKGGGACPAVVEEARAEIDIDEFLQYDGHQVWFKLGDKESRYSLSRDEYAVYLEPIEVNNVISHESGENQPKNPQSLAIILQNERFAVLGLNGRSRDIDYRDQLREVAKAEGLILVDEVYKGFIQDSLRGIWVLVDDSQIPNTIPAIVGEITYDSGGWGIERVDVAIKRVQHSPYYSY